MTFSILAFDPLTQTLAGASATGNLCVGGWVLRADSRAGISASQGAKPSTLWGEDVIDLMASGLSAVDAVEKVVKSDADKNYRQLAALDTTGTGSAFSGVQNYSYVDQIIEPNLVLAGNILQDHQVLSSMRNKFKVSTEKLPMRLIESLEAAVNAGGDRRGVMSASILIVNQAFPPLSLRIDYHKTPLQALRILLEKTEEKKYQNWLEQLPTRA